MAIVSIAVYPKRAIRYEHTLSMHFDCAFLAESMHVNPLALVCCREVSILADRVGRLSLTGEMQ